jgi:hypothetical protein
VSQISLGQYSDLFGKTDAFPAEHSKDGQRRVEIVEGANIRIIASLENLGPDRPVACNTSFTSSFASIQNLPCEPLFKDTGSGHIERFAHATLFGTGPQPGRFTPSVSVDVSSIDAFDPNPANSTKTKSFVAVPAPKDEPRINRVGPANASGGLQGARGSSADRANPAATGATAAPIKRVEVAIIDVSRAGQCRWLRSLGGGFTRLRPSDSCDAPVWLPAHGTERWQLSLMRRLSRGRYGFLARDIDAKGRTSALFSTAKRTQAQLVVEK